MKLNRRFSDSPRLISYMFWVIAMQFVIILWGLYINNNMKNKICLDEKSIIHNLRSSMNENAFALEACLNVTSNCNQKDIPKDCITTPSTPPTNNNNMILSPCTSDSLRTCVKEIWHYESPISIHPEPNSMIMQRFSKISDEVIDWHISEQVTLWTTHLKNWKTSYDQHSPFQHNGMIPIEDDYLLYAMVMTFEPNLILEIGSGHSTKTAHMALLQLPSLSQKNQARQHVCIEPFRSQVIDVSQEGNIPIRIIKKIVQEVDPSEFSALQKNDILFIDSSHVIKAFGDTILELVFILPLLPVGVIVHVHDICLPENYPIEWLSSSGSQSEYTEQFMLAAFLYGNVKWKVLWANWKMAMDHPQLFKDIGLPGEKHGSIWLQRIA